MLPRWSKFLFSVLALSIFVCAAAREKPEIWLEVRSPHFVVISNSNEKQARRVADQFERIRAVFRKVFPRMQVDPGVPIVALALKDEKSFKSLVPETFLQKGQLQRAGLFLKTAEKNYMLLRLNAEQENPFHLFYHEYTHLLIHQNAESVPVWLDEGLAEFYGNSEIHEKEVWLGRPSESDVLKLRESKLLPLETLFAVDHTSPYYNEENKGSIFYAESWALTHYLMTKGFAQNRDMLGEFVTTLAQSGDITSAATRAFGDLRLLEEELGRYAGQASFNYLRMKGETQVEEEGFTTRALSAAESAASRGDILVHNQRYADARALLEEALRLDPKSAPAHESMGFLEFQQGHAEQAKKWFTEAVKLDSRSYLAHYYYAVMTLQETRDGAPPDDGEKSLRTAIGINPHFAPAYDALANFYGMRGENLEDARLLALKGMQLDPGNIRYRLTVANLMLRMKRPNDALVVARRAAAMAKSSDELAAAQAVLSAAQQYQEYLERVKREEDAAARAKQELDRQLAEEQKAEPEPSRQDEELSPPRLRHRDESARGPRAVVDGAIKEVKCSAPTAMDLTLVASGRVLNLRTDNYFKVDYRALNFTPAGELQPCSQLRGMNARITYFRSQARSSEGEIIAVELRR